jgi:hypothetical protein
MKKSVYYNNNRQRRDEFALETKIIKSGNKLEVIKNPITSTAQSHLDQIPKTYKQLRKINQLAKITKIVPAKKVKGTISSPHINGQSAERRLIIALLKNDEKTALEVLSTAKSVIDVLPITRANPSKNRGYKKVFGNTYTSTLDCTKIGVVDLNLDNFIVDAEERWHLFDYEWKFNFPIAKDLLFERLLFWFFAIRYRDVILLHSAKYNVVQIADHVFVPEYIFRKYEKHFLNFEELMNAEYNFQRYVYQPSDTYGLPPSKLFGVNLIPARPPEHNKLKAARHELSLMGQFEELRELHKLVTASHQELERQYSAVLDSRAYKYAQKLQKVKKNLGN